jgi:hypothetical protein
MAQSCFYVEKELDTDEAESHVVCHNNFFSDRLLALLVFVNELYMCCDLRYRRILTIAHRG